MNRRHINKGSTVGMFILVTFLLAAVLGLGFYVLKKLDIIGDGGLRLFEHNSFIFQKVYFDRFIAYGNVYDGEDPSEHFQRQVIFYIKGYGKVSANTKAIRRVGDEIHYSPDTPYLFDVTPVIDTKDIIVVDQIDPKPVSLEDAAKMGATLSIGGAYLGASAVGAIPFAGLVTNVQTRALAGIAGAGLTFAITTVSLNGLKLADEIQQTEKDEVISKSIEVIKHILQTDTNLVNQYKRTFKGFIKSNLDLPESPVVDVVIKPVSITALKPEGR